MDNDQLARAAVTNIVKMMAIKWTIIIVATKVARRFTENR